MTAPATLPPTTRRPRRGPDSPAAPAPAAPADAEPLGVDEFLRRYENHPDAARIELVRGKVRRKMPVRQTRHSLPNNFLSMWVGVYHAATPGTEPGENGTCRLSPIDAPQPDSFLRIHEDAGGRTRLTADDYVDGGPELVCEIAASSAATDAGEKREAYRLAGVPEVLIWRTEGVVLDWCVLRGEGAAARYEPLPADEGPDGGVLRSEVFPGLWLDRAALLRGDAAGVLACLNAGLAAPEHVAFANDLAARLDAAG